MLIVDPIAAHNLADMPLVPARDSIGLLWGAQRQHVRVAPTHHELGALCRAIRAGKRVVVLVDEAHYFLQPTRGQFCEPLAQLMRAAQHAECEVLLTTQHLTGDVPAVALSCTTRLSVFRCTSPRVLKVLETEWGFDLSQVSTLPRFSFIPKQIGFEP